MSLAERFDKIHLHMEGGNYLTAGEMALWNDARYGYHGCEYRPHRDGMAATGIGLAAGLGGSALLATLVGIWAVNQASKARTEGTHKSLDIMTAGIIQERQRTDGINLYVEQSLRNSASATGGNADALALALAANYNRFGGGNNGQVCPTPVALFSPAKPCDCPSSCGC